jgi:hypothetical protein
MEYTYVIIFSVKYCNLRSVRGSNPCAIILVSVSFLFI